MEKKASVLIIEDDRYISNFICMSLKQEGYRYLKAATGEEALRLCYEENPDVIILDLGLPDVDGIEVIEHIRSHCERPIIVVSARQEESEKIKALDMGADDYVVKPFYMGELLARIRVAMRKSEKAVQMEMTQTFQRDYLKIDFMNRAVYVEEKKIHLTPIEYKLLALLVANRGKVLTHNQILSRIWGSTESGDANSLRVFMATLRRKIEKDTTNPRFIVTEVGVGYRFAER
ncbi:MAG: response regulator transcription factor [Lachnospiraceae bacterium]|nr:response regulator transcription factor [Lachnospiraceae bacterium]